MTYRISHETEAGRLVVRVDGELDATAALALEQRLSGDRNQSVAPILDLSGTRFADSEGAAFLSRARDQGVELRGASHFITELLALVESRAPSIQGRKE